VEEHQDVSDGSGSFADTYLLSVAEVLQGSDRIGLGFFLAERVIATCSHVVGAAGADLKIRVTGVTRDVRVVLEDEKLDVAFLQLDTAATGVQVMPLGIDEGQHQGVAVQLVAWTADQEAPLLRSSHVEGVLSAPLPPSGERRDVYQLGVESVPGYSGGPAVLAGTRKVCGMVVANDMKQGAGLLVPAASLLDCYRRLVARTGREGGEASALPPAYALPPSPPPPGGRYRVEHHLQRPDFDARVLDLFDGGSPIVLCAPTMSGKTWWLNHLLPRFEERLRGKGRVVTLASFGKSDSLKTILLSLITSLVRGVRGDAKAARDAWDDDLVESAAATNCLEDHFFAQGDHEALLVLDLADAFWDNPRQEDFFALFRHWSQSGDPWPRLRLLVAYSTTPSVWLNSPADSPFAVAPLVISDWSAEEILRGAAVHGLGTATGRDVARLVEHVGGHPYLVRAVLHEARAAGSTLEATASRLEADPEILRAPLERMFQRSGLRDDAGLRGALLDVADRRGGPLDYKHYRRLADAGLIVGTAAKPRLRAPIAARVLRGE
jgi:hypothetical protein